MIARGYSNRQLGQSREPLMVTLSTTRRRLRYSTREWSRVYMDPYHGHSWKPRCNSLRIFPHSYSVATRERRVTLSCHATMLPLHRSLPSEAGLSSCLSKRPSFVLSKLLVRWLALAGVIFAVLWFGDLLNFGRFEPLLRPSNSPDTITTATATTTTTTTNQQSLSNSPDTPTTTTANQQTPSNIPPKATKEQAVWAQRKNEVRIAFKHAWSGYKNIAYPNDELLSISGGQSNKFFSFPPLPSYLSFPLISFIKL